ncbi:hypothetical protein ILUMI_25681 [Ignelater luminosus]|uniref:Uncharacterized protein n=1 Tax=Ignelater luminosus TaxID=2038154 RepID=A0A8K0C575_IGNLU|nr:hypothetical protein ILUMI_25681 [Ignelater luminosus]
MNDDTLQKIEDDFKKSNLRNYYKAFKQKLTKYFPTSLQFRDEDGEEIAHDNKKAKAKFSFPNERGQALFTTEKPLRDKQLLQKETHKGMDSDKPRREGKTKNEIDFIIANRKDTIQDVTVINKFTTRSDHRVFRSKLTTHIKKERSKMVPKASRQPRGNTETYEEKKKYEREV